MKRYRVKLLIRASVREGEVRWFVADSGLFLWQAKAQARAAALSGGWNRRAPSGSCAHQPGRIVQVIVECQEPVRAGLPNSAPGG